MSYHAARLSGELGTLVEFELLEENTSSLARLRKDPDPVAFRGMAEHSERQRYKAPYLLFVSITTFDKYAVNLDADQRWKSPDMNTRPHVHRRFE